MIRGLYTSGIGMSTQMQKLDVVSNNIANASTTGFKTGTVVTQSFPEYLMQSIDAMPGSKPHNITPIGNVNLGLSVSTIHTNFANGSLEPTQAPLDLAITGNGFFAVNTTNRAGNTQEGYTRNGSLSLSANRTLVTQNGDSILGEGGNSITIPEGEISINNSGRIYVDGTYVDTIRVVNFENPEMLRAQGYDMFLAPDEANQVPFTGQVQQGFLEGSNVNIVREMVEMISLSRAYEANQRMITIQDTTLGQAVSDIARK